jgi:hypothetical protein
MRHSERAKRSDALLRCAFGTGFETHARGWVDQNGKGCKRFGAFVAAQIDPDDFFVRSRHDRSAVYCRLTGSQLTRDASRR